MKKNKTTISIQIIALIVLIFLGTNNVYASEVTGTLSSSSASSGSSGGSAVSGSIGGNSGGGSSITGTVSGGGSGGGGGGGGSSGFSGTVGGGGSSDNSSGQSNSNNGLVLGESTFQNTPGLPNTGINLNGSNAYWAILFVLMSSIALGYLALNIKK